MKFIKGLLGSILFVFIILGGVGYYNGLRLNNYQEFISTIISKYSKKDEVPTEKKVEKLKSSKRNHEFKDQNVDNHDYDLQPAPRNPFAKIDRYARQCPQTEQLNVESLSNYLEREAKSDIEKARVIFVWLTENISYDDESFNSGNDGDNSVEGVLLNRKAVCEGFSNLFLALGENMGLEIEKVIGYAKGYGYSQGMKYKETNHAWNVIKVDGNWRVFDATWGQGNGENVNGKLKSKKEFNDYWFNVDPFEAIFSHLPQDSEYAFVQPTLSLNSFEKFPQVDAAYFEMGFNGKETYKRVCAEMGSKFPQCFKLETYVQMYAAPKNERLQLNEQYRFEFFIPRAYSVAIIDAENTWTYFDREKGKFKLGYTPKTEGELEIVVKFEIGGDSYHTILIYNVVKHGEPI